VRPQLTAALGLAVLALAWLGPLPALAAESFTGHMVMHLAVLAVATPLLGHALPRLAPGLLGAGAPRLALLASALELVVIWAWHAPAMHAFARQEPAGLVLEQASFLAVGLFLWSSALAPSGGEGRAGAGVLALLLTSMHMTLLGALIALAPRQLYACYAPAPGTGWSWLPTALADQQFGGALMLMATSGIYLGAGLWRLRGLLEVQITAPLTETIQPCPTSRA
jgi:putative membrane protein